MSGVKDIRDEGVYYKTRCFQGVSPHHEDDFASMLGYEGFEHPTLFAVFDGHGGSSCARFCKRNLLKRIMTHDDIDRDPKFAMEDAFLEVDDEYVDLSRELNLGDGSTATVLYVVPNEIDQTVKFYLAAAGDSRAILVNEDGTLRQLSFDHSLERPDELERVKTEGAIIKSDADDGSFPRIFTPEGGGIAVTRSIGDSAFKPFVTGRPEIEEGELNEKTKYIVLASDGLWTDISNEEAAELVMKYGLEKGVYAMSSKAMKRGCEDNITITVVDVGTMYQLLLEHMDTKNLARQQAREEKIKEREQEPIVKDEVQSEVDGEIFKTFGIPNDPFLNDLLLWKNPVRTFLWFSAISMGYYLNKFAGYSLLTLGSYLLLSQLVVSIFLVNFSETLINLRLLPPDFDAEDHLERSKFMTDDLINGVAKAAFDFTSVAFERWKNIVGGSQARWLVAIRNISYFFVPVTVATLFYVATLLLFTIPLIYVSEKERIDRASIKFKTGMYTFGRNMKQRYNESVKRATEAFR